MTEDRPKRPPPTIDLEPNPPGEARAWRRRLKSWRATLALPSWTPRWGASLTALRLPLLAAASGVLAALGLLAILWFAGLMTQPTLAPADPALAARIAGLEQSLEAMRQSSQQMQQTLQRQGDGLKSALDDLTSAPRAASAAVDLSPLSQRIAELEQSIRGLTAAQPAQPETVDPATARMIVANQLAAAVGRGEPYASVLAAAKQSGGTTALTPLEPFAATGVPDDAALARELIALLPQLEPKPVAQPTPTGLIERLEASAARLVRVRPVGDAAGDDPSSLVQRIAAAARRNDVASARRDLDRLAPAQRAPAAAWIARYEAREAARKASLAFATEALVALPRR